MEINILKQNLNYVTSERDEANFKLQNLINDFDKLNNNSYEKFTVKFFN
jgi:hypothetical protein